MTGMLPRPKDILLAAVGALAVAFSAHSQTFSVAYISGGDVWVLGGVNGAPTRLTNSGACQSPRFSADASLIAFQENGTVRVVDVSKRNVIEPGAKVKGNFTWAPQEDTLAVWNEAAVYLFRQRDSWAGGQIINFAPKSIVLDVSFNRDGQGLLVSLRRLGTHGGLDIGTIETVDLRKQDQRATLLAEPGDGFDLYEWSRDSKMLLFWKNPSFSSSFQADGLELYEMSVAERTARRLDTVTTLVHKDLLQLSPDGGSLLVTLTPHQNGRETWSSSSIAEANLLSGGVRVVSSPNTSALFPAWSPGGDDIAYVQAPVGRDHMNERRIWLTRRYGEQKRQLISGSNYREENPIWLSQDTILFCRIDGSYHASLWSATKDGLHLRKLVDLPTLPDKAFGYFGYVDWGQYFDVWLPHG